MRDRRLVYVAVVLYAIVCVGISLWLVGRAFDHMTDPCRTEAQRSTTPVCMTGSR